MKTPKPAPSHPSRRILFAAACLTAALCFVACASTGGAGGGEDSSDPEPTWLEEGKHADYPSHAYVTGLGEAENRRAAYASALSEIAFQVKADIDSSFTMDNTQRAVSKGGDTEVTETSERDEVVELKSQLDTMGLAKMVDTHVDESGVYHVFAALDRSEAHSAFADKYRQRREAHAKTAENLAQNIDSTNMRVLSNHVDQLSRAHRELKSLQQLVTALGGSTETDETRVARVLDVARERLADLRSETSCEICVRAKDEESSSLTETLRNKLADWIADRDIEVVPCGASPSTTDHSRRLRLEATLNMRCKRPDRAEDLHMCRAFAQMELEHRGKQTTILSKSVGGEEIRETRRNLRHAQSLTLDNLVALAHDFLADVFGRQS